MESGIPVGVMGQVASAAPTGRRRRVMASCPLKFTEAVKPMPTHACETKQ